MKRLGMLVCFLVTAAVSAASGASFNDTAEGDYANEASWAESGSPADDVINPDTVLIDEYTITLAGAGQASNDTITVEPGGTLDFGGAGSNRLAGAAIILNGGSVSCDMWKAWRGPARGDFLVTADSAFYMHIWTSKDTGLFGSLDFGPGEHTLSFANTVNNNAKPSARFTGAIIGNGGTIDVGTRTWVELDGPAVTVGETLNKTWTNSLTILTSFGMAIPGGATMVAATGSSPLTVTGGWVESSVAYRDAGLWRFDVDSGPDGGIDAVMTNRKDTVSYPGHGTPFAAEDAGYVEITGVVAGREMMLKLELANVTDIAEVIAALDENPMFSDIEAAGSDAIRVRFEPAWSGTAYFLWDNAPGAVHALCADVTRVSPMLLPGTVIAIF